MQDLEKQYEREEFIKRLKMVGFVVFVIALLIIFSFAIYYFTHK